MTESTSRQERVRHLGELYASVTAESTFTEHQEAARGTVPDDAALAAVVRGFYAGSSDGEIAERLGVTARQVARARRNLHLFRPADTDAPFDLSALREALSEGSTAAEAARELGVPESTTSRYAGVLRRQADARRSGYYSSVWNR